ASPTGSLPPVPSPPGEVSSLPAGFLVGSVPAPAAPPLDSLPSVSPAPFSGTETSPSSAACSSSVAASTLACPGCGASRTNWARSTASASAPAELSVYRLLSTPSACSTSSSSSVVSASTSSATAAKENESNVPHASALNDSSARMVTTPAAPTVIGSVWGLCQF